MTPDFQRVVEEARPAWFLRENTPKAPDIKPLGYDVRSFKLDNSALDSGDGTGHEQMRTRRFWFGVREGECPELRRWIDFALFLLPKAVHAVSGRHPGELAGCDGHRTDKKTRTQAVASDDRAGPVALGGSGEPKRTRVTAVGGHDGTEDALGDKAYRAHREAKRTAPVTGRNEGAVGAPGVDYSPPRRTLADMLRLQGLPEDWLEHQPWTMQAKRKMIGNGVPIPMGRELARAIREALR